MKRILSALILTLFFLTLIEKPLFAQIQKHPQRLKRSESFLGIHFDFHANDDCQEIGKDVNREMIEYIVDMVQPDYVQCDAKGHPGRSSYPTNVGNRAPGFVLDPLKIWREVTAERGVALYVHYSGVWDEKAVERNPTWACHNENGEIRKNLISVFGPYADELLIPQIKELIDDYDLDGIWIDGECWATERDYSETAIRLFQQKMGIQQIPKSAEDPYWIEFSEFCRNGYRNYLKHYVTELHNHNPNFQIASNWAYSSMMPEPVRIDVDFISGDYSAKNSLNSARFEGRAMVHQGKPWDLMAWSFTWSDGLYSTKSIPQLQREAAIVLALGGGFQAYFPQKRDGSIRKWQMKLMQAVAKFCRARQAICHRAEPVPQIGLILSGKSFYHKSKKLFSASGSEYDGIRGILQCLLDGQHVVDVVMEHHLQNRVHDYPLLIYPEWEYIDPQFNKLLLNYVREGGKLLLVGPHAIKLFEKELNVALIGESLKQVNGLAFNGWLAGINSEYQAVRLGEQVKAVGEIYKDNDFYGDSAVAASITDYGAGKIAAVYLNLGERYLNATTSVCRDFLSALVRELLPNPMVEVSGSHYVDVTVNKIDGKLAVNLVNTSGLHADKNVYVFDEIPTIGPLTISIQYEKAPSKITIEPEGKLLPFSYHNGKIGLIVHKLEIHSIILVE